MEDRSTAELIITLGDDFNRCYENILQSFDEGTLDSDGNLDADYEFHARQLIRAAFAYIEGVICSVKIKALDDCHKNGIKFSPKEQFIAAEVDYELNNKGEIIDRPAKIKLTRNIRFAFSLYEKAHSFKPQFDASAEWWSCLQESIKVRDRIMHPRMPEDLDVSPKELMKMIKAKYGFDEVLKRYISLHEA